MKSEQSSRRSRHAGYNNSVTSNSQVVLNSSHHRSRHSHRSSKSKRAVDMAPFQTSINLEDSRDGQEIIEVQILPQDENWGENTTAITGDLLGLCSDRCFLCVIVMETF